MSRRRELEEGQYIRSNTWNTPRERLYEKMEIIYESPGHIKVTGYEANRKLDVVVWIGHVNNLSLPMYVEDYIVLNQAGDSMAEALSNDIALDFLLYAQNIIKPSAGLPLSAVEKASVNEPIGKSHIVSEDSANAGSRYNLVTKKVHIRETSGKRNVRKALIAKKKE